jgi:regulator of ribonuclease activity A
MDFKTTDLCDDFSDRLQIAEPIFNDYGGEVMFCGPIVTLKVFEDNSLVRALLEEPGEGRVLVVDGGGSIRCALLGDQLAEMAEENDWAGIVVNGCVRDSTALSELGVGVKALGVHPLIMRRCARCAKAGLSAHILILERLFLLDRPGTVVSHRA